MRHTHSAALLVLISSLIATGCGDTDTPDPPEETLEEHLCEHFDNGPFQDQSAASVVADAPLVAVEHTPVRLTLLESEGQFSGFGEFSVESAGSVVVALGLDVPVSVTNGAGDMQNRVGQSPITGVCSTLVRMDMYDLPVGHYVVELGPSDTEEITVLVGFPGR